MRLDNDYRDLITIIIPTHNRPLLVYRAMDYYSLWGCKVIIGDSSHTFNEKIKGQNVKYFHFPNEVFSSKILLCLQLVETPFVCISSDDDFLALNGIKSGLNFLLNNIDYCSVHGQYGQFQLAGNHIYFYFNKKIQKHILCEDPKERVIASAGISVNPLAILYRTQALIQTYLVCGKQSELVEYNINSVGLFFGKQIMLPDFWMARDVARYTEYPEYNYLKAQDGKYIHKLKLINFLKNENEGIEYKKRFSTLFSVITNKSYNEGSLLFDKVFFDIFLSSVRNKEKLTLTSLFYLIIKCLKKCLKYFIPEYIVLWRRRRIAKFPFMKNPNYLLDWNLIESSIRKHGNISTISTKKV